MSNHAHELALVGSPTDAEDLMDKMLDVLDDDYKELIHVVQARDISITFKELHENYMTLKPWCYQPTLSIFTF